MSPLHAARAYRRDGHYDLALSCLSALPDDSLVLAERAALLVRLGRASEALRAARAALAAEERPTTWLALAEAATAAGELGEARGAAERGLSLTRAQHDEVSVATALALDGLAAVLQQQGQAAEALAPATRALAILDQLGADPALRATVMHTLAEAEHRAGQHAGARSRWSRVIALRTRVLGPEHPETAAARFGLALSLGRMGRAHEAVTEHRAALAIAEARLGASHPAVAAGAHGLAQALRRAGDFTGARDALRQALRISERAQGKEHPDTWITRFELARMEVDCGDFDGFARMEAASARLCALLGADHPTVLATRRWL